MARIHKSLYIDEDQLVRVDAAAQREDRTFSYMVRKALEQCYPAKGAKPAKEVLIPEKRAGFPQFWSVYPRKVGKAAAQRAWVARGCAQHLPAILAAIEAQQRPGGGLGKDQLKRVDGNHEDYRPYPASWLNAERYKDEILPVQVLPCKLSKSGCEEDAVEGHQFCEDHMNYEQAAAGNA